MAYVPIVEKPDGTWRIAGPIHKEKEDFSALRPDARVIWCFDRDVKVAWSEEEVMGHFNFAPAIRSTIASRREAEFALKLEQPVATD